MGGVCYRGNRPEHPGNQSVDAVGVLQHVIVGETQDLDAAAAHVLVAGGVLVGISVGFAVNLYDQLRVHAGEVGRVGTEWLLAAEMPAVLAELPEKGPHGTLGTGLVEAQ